MYKQLYTSCIEIDINENIFTILKKVVMYIESIKYVPIHITILSSYVHVDDQGLFVLSGYVHSSDGHIFTRTRTVSQTPNLIITIKNKVSHTYILAILS